MSISLRAREKTVELFLFNVMLDALREHLKFGFEPRVALPAGFEQVDQMPRDLVLGVRLKNVNSFVFLFRAGAQPRIEQLFLDRQVRRKRCFDLFC